MSLSVIQGQPNTIGITQNQATVNIVEPQHNTVFVSHYSNTVNILQPAPMTVNVSSQVNTINVIQPEPATVNISIGGARGARGLDGTGGGAAISAAGSSVGAGTVHFKNANNVSFGMDYTDVTASASFPVQSELSFANSNGITFGRSGSTLTASHNGITTAAPVTHIHGTPVLNISNLDGTIASNSAGMTLNLTAKPFGLSAGSQSADSGVMVFANSNGVSFGLSGSSQITASHNGLTTGAASNHTHGDFALNLDNLFGTTASNSAGLSLSLSANQGIGAISAGTQQATAGSIVFANSNGISFGLSGSSRITASHNGLTTAAQSNHSHGNVALHLTNILGTTSSNSGGLSLSLSANAGGGGLGSIVVSAGSTNNQISNILFANSNGVSFGLSGSTITASAAGGSGGGVALAGGGLTITNNTAILSANGGALTIASGAGSKINFSVPALSSMVGVGLIVSTTGNTMSLIGRALPAFYLDNMTVSTATNSTGYSISMSGGGGGGAALGGGGLTVESGTAILNAAGGAITITNGGLSSFNFSVPNSSALYGINITLSSNSDTLSFSAAPPGMRFTYGTDEATTQLSEVYLLNANNVSWGFDGSTLTASAAGGTGGVGGAAISAGSQSANTGTVVFSNSNGITFGMSGNSRVTASHNGLTTAAQTNHSHGNISLVLNNISATANSASNGLTLSLSAATGSDGGDGYNFVGVNGASIGSALVFQLSNSNNVTFGLNGSTITASASYPGQTSFQLNNGNGITFGTNGSTVTASHNGLTTAAATNHSHGNPTLALNNISGTTASASNGFTLSLSANGAVAASGSNGSSVFNTLSFGNLNGLSFYLSNGSIVGSYTDAGAGSGIDYVRVSAGTTHNDISNLSFANSNGVSFGINGSTITASAAGGTGAAGIERHYISLGPAYRTTNMNFALTVVSNKPHFLPFVVDATSFNPKIIRVAVSGVASNNRSLVATWRMGLYSRVNETQISLWASDSYACSYTDSSQTTMWNGLQWLDFVGLSNSTMNRAGEWVFAWHVSAYSRNATWANMMMCGDSTHPDPVGRMFANTWYSNRLTYRVLPFWGQYSQTTTAMPGSVAMSQIYGNNSQYLYRPWGVLFDVDQPLV